MPCRVKIGLIEHSLCNKTQAQGKREAEHSPPYKTLSHLANYFIVSCRIEGKSVAGLEDYERRIQRFINSLPTTSSTAATSITAREIREYFFELQSQGQQLASIRSHYKVLKTFFNWLIGEGLIDKSPMTHIKPPKLPKKLVQPFSLQDIDNILTMV
jgi:integrase/recombinase XerD